MSKVKYGKVTRKRHKKILKQAKGFWGQRKNVFKRAKETLLRAWANAFKSRKLKKRDMRALFITRLNAAVRQYDLSYSVFINKINKSKILINSKILSQLSIYEPKVFEKIINICNV